LVGWLGNGWLRLCVGRIVFGALGRLTHLFDVKQRNRQGLLLRTFVAGRVRRARRVRSFIAADRICIFILKRA
jgi:hypothetical protein